MKKPDFGSRLNDEIAENDEKLARIGGSFNNFFNQSYQDPRQAEKNMENAKLGESGLHDVLKFEPDRFGEAPKDPAGRANAQDARQKLPGLFSDYRNLRDENDGLRRTQMDWPEAASKPGDGQQKAAPSFGERRPERELKPAEPAPQGPAFGKTPGSPEQGAQQAMPLPAADGHGNGPDGKDPKPPAKGPQQNSPELQRERNRYRDRDDFER